MYLAGMRSFKNLNRYHAASMVRGVYAISGTRVADQLPKQVYFIPVHDLLQNNHNQ